ncbi:MAG: hypothetical protein GWN07_30975 [Actinobacteria bacterium]|nr:hypothetical protein [Actinomycetota bacterium]NIU69814.1 hypothetical protein [Actinomycetota bacterium]NIW31690.1 hypothetical protein [Actinomycetota bacterium]NIX24003.1 hypothetical protein [Actinomycetota bacterium]
MRFTAAVRGEMVGPVPLQLVDELLLPFHLGHVAIALLVLTVPAGLVKGSGKLVGLILIGFGGLLVAVPSIDSDAGVLFAVVGIALMVIGPIVYSTASR